MGAVGRYIKRTDIVYLIICIALSVISVVTLFSVGQYGGLDLGGTFGDLKPALTQIFASVLGVVCCILVSLVDYHLLLRFWPVVLAVCWGLVLLTFIPGVGYSPGDTGSQSWIALPFGLSFQPTEIAKIGLAIAFAGHLAKVGKRLHRPLVLLGVLGHLLGPVLLVHLQGDDGTALVFFAMGVFMLIFAGINRWAVLGCGIAAAIATPLIWTYVLGDYQRQRFLGLFDPAPYANTTMYQQIQARQAIGAGGLFGKGLFAEHHYVPRTENDFFFSYYAESFGFIGCLVLMALLFILLYKTLLAARGAPDGAGAYICVGVFGALCFQTVVNIGMNLSLVPVMGITLPFLSAGGTSVLMLYLSAGLVLGVCRRSRQSPAARLRLSSARG